MLRKLFKHKNHSIESTIFHNMVLSSAIFIAILFIGTSYLFLRNTFTSESKSALQQLEYISDHLKYYLDAIDNYTKTIITNTDVQQYMTDVHQHKFFATADTQNKSMQRQIRQIIQSTPFIHSVTLYTTDGHPLVTTEPYTRLTDLSEFPKTPQWIISQKQALTDARQEVKVVSKLHPFYSISSGKLIGYIEISMPEPEISSIYKYNTLDHSVFMLDMQGIVQSASVPSMLDTDYDAFEDMTSTTKEHFTFSMGNLLFYNYFSPLNWYIVHEIPLMRFLQPLFVLFFISLIMTVLIIASYIYVSHKIAGRITAPLNYLVGHIQTVKEGNWVPIEEISCTSEVHTLLTSFNNMIYIQNEMKNNLIEAEKLKRHLSLNLLQQQINPHFLYNTLDNICSLAELDEKEILIQLVMNLSAFYRFSLSNGKMHVTLERELEISRAYLEILQVRYYGKFSYTITCPEELKTCSCIKLLLQPIIENSIYHGIKELGVHGQIDILCENCGDYIVITISDNGHGISEEIIERIWKEDNDHFGIKNIHQRIQLYYGTDYGLQIFSPPQGGCCTILTIPKKEEPSCH